MIPGHILQATLPPRDSSLPPAYFKPALDVTTVREIPYDDTRSKAPTAAQLAGLRYENRWHSFARSLWGSNYHTYNRTQLCFASKSGWRVCRPDAILALPNDRIVIFEVKIRHIEDAWWQLHELYKPVLSKLYYGYTFIPVEVSKTFDPQVNFPGSTAPIDPAGLEGELPEADTLLLSWGAKV